MFLHMIIEGRGVQGERDPGPGQRELVDAVARWATAHARMPIVAIVFDGTYEDLGAGLHEHNERTVVVATRDRSVDDVIVGEVEELRADAEPVIVVTSSAPLRSRVEALGAKVITGAAFARTVFS